jgi:inorganic pyrophosphatase
MPIANLWRELPPGPDAPRVIYVVVEIPKRSRNKYEYDEQGGFIEVTVQPHPSPSGFAAAAAGLGPKGLRPEGGGGGVRKPE